MYASLGAATAGFVLGYYYGYKGGVYRSLDERAKARDGRFVPGWGVGAYAVATATALMRIYNDRHWTSDLLGGAALGILSADIAYWLLPWERRLFHITPGSGKALTVLPTPYGLSIACVF